MNQSNRITACAVAVMVRARVTKALTAASVMACTIGVALIQTLIPSASMALDIVEPPATRPAKVAPSTIRPPEFRRRPPPIMVLPDKAARPIQLQGANIWGNVLGTQASTTVELIFFNPNNRVLEGELQFALEDGQRIDGFALDIDGRLRDAVPVDKAKGQMVFEDVIRGRIDPALLEATSSNTFKLRVYPLPAQGTRRVQLRIQETLAVNAGRVRFNLPTAFETPVGELSVDMQFTGVRNVRTFADGWPDLGTNAAKVRQEGIRVTGNRQNFRGTIGMEYDVVEQAAVQVESDSSSENTFFAAEIPLAGFAGRSITGAISSALSASGTASIRPRPSVIGLVWDASATGRERNHAAELALLDQYFSKRCDNCEVRLTEVRNTVERVRSFRVNRGDWRELRQHLNSMIYDGATNLAGYTTETKVDEILLFTDGLHNFGESVDVVSAFSPGSSAAEKTGFFNSRASSAPVHTIATTARVDASLLKHIASKTGGVYIDNKRAEDASAVVQAMQTVGPRIVNVEGNYLRDFAYAAQPQGDRVMVYGIATRLPATLRVTVEVAGRVETIDVAIPNRYGEQYDNQNGGNYGNQHGIVARAWAAQRISDLDAQYEFNRGEIRRLGQRYGVVSRETSLIVLDRIEDYVRYEIEPPASMQAELKAQYEQQRANGRRTLDTARRDHLSRIVSSFNEKIRWWEKSFSKERPLSRNKAKENAVMEERVGELSDVQRPRIPNPVPRATAPNASPPPPAAESAPASAPSPSAPITGGTKDSLRASGDAAQRSSTMQEKKSEPQRRAPDATISLNMGQWKSDAPYARRMRDARADDVYRIYLDERQSYERTIGFYLDVANILIERGQTALGLRVLSNLAEMDLENRHILRVLGYRLMQANMPQLAVPMFRRVLTLSPNEPQSYRDLGLAFASSKQPQQAVNQLYEVVVRPWHNRFPGVELIALAELNAIAATNKVDTSRFDPRLIKNLPLDVRAVLTWDADNTDIDLWVTDPHGQKAFYSNPLTPQGGRMSADFTGGYGPEEFSLKSAVPGKYTIEAQYFGDRKQTVAAPTTLQVRVTTGFGTARQRDQIITLQLKDAREVVYVGQIDVR